MQRTVFGIFKKLEHPADSCAIIRLPEYPVLKTLSSIMKLNLINSFFNGYLELSKSRTRTRTHTATTNPEGEFRNVLLSEWSKFNKQKFPEIKKEAKVSETFSCFSTNEVMLDRTLLKKTRKE